MADMLTIATTATNAFNRSLQVTSHNIANVNTEGYSRQRAELSALNFGNAGGYGGSGVEASRIERIMSDFVNKQLQSAQSSVTGFETRLSIAKQVEGAVSSVDQGVENFLLNYFDSWQDLATNPQSNIAKDDVLNQASNLVAAMNATQQLLSQTERQINEQIGGVVNSINSQLADIEQINSAISKAGNNSQQPFDLLDKRDKAVNDLGKLLGITVTLKPDGQVEIYSENNRVPLLADNKVFPLEIGKGVYPGLDRAELMSRQSGTEIQITHLLEGSGELGGLLEARTNLIDKTYDQLGVMLNGFVASQNTQNNQGWTSNDELGGNIFTPLEVEARANVNNTSPLGTSNVTVSFNAADMLVSGNTVADADAKLANDMQEVGALRAASYEISFDGTDYRVTNLSTKEFAEFSVSDDIEFEGLLFEPDGLAPGDRFQVSPHRAMVESFRLEASEPSDLATRGQRPDMLAATDVLAPAASGDNTNAARFAALQSKSLLFDRGSGATATIAEGFAQVSTDVGRYINRTESQLMSAQTGYNYLFEQRESIAGVNLDEEAANLIRFQQAYQAAAQVIQTSQSMFQTLLGAVRN
ncbi:flagellar hook-associated protein FlgK [Thiomicrospira sp. ALE5]|uniref:flagellar hook-associated protein FlgK n=1 Tax=Thiomicrospira sp. ALE5 TaxID=748650 RepID=UPI0008F26522|nr:flagellar hook-associated protein FlgK [Thiomicrospira sp. ALE5]SFR59499.1 flagellar hook-associated protein 1 FlgK [Thiomicrospira sp. ALE5]